MKHLLDVNVLIAVIWATHADHSRAEKWLIGKEVATCPLTELGFLRISTHPKALGAAMSDARRLLEDFMANHDVEFISADLPALKSRASKSDEVTDVYLADLAARNGMKLASLDSGIKHAAVELIVR